MRLKFRKELRNTYLLAGLGFSLLIIALIWNLLIYTQMSLFFVPTVEFWKELNGDHTSLNIVSLLLSGSEEQQGFLAPYLHQAHHDFVVMMATMLGCWLFAWGGLYCLAKQAHKGKLKFSTRYQLLERKTDLVWFVLAYGLLVYQVFNKTHLEAVFWGIFALYFIHAALLFMILFLFCSLYSELKQKPLCLVNILSLSIYLISSHAFELLHTFLSHYPKVYFFANHGSPSFGTALSFTFVGDIAMAGYTLALAFLAVKKQRFSANYWMGVLCTYALFFIVFMTHHFIVVHTTNAADDIFDRSFRQVLQASPTRAEAIKHFNEIHRYKIRITDIFSFKKELQGCRVCVLDTSKPVDLEGLEKELAQRQADRNFTPIHPRKFNLKLVYIGADQEGNIVSALRLSNTTSFFTVALYSLFYLTIMAVWLSLIFSIQRVHVALAKKSHR